MARMKKVIINKSKTAEIPFEAKEEKKTVDVLSGVSNDAEDMISELVPYMVEFTLRGVSDLLFHRWSNEAVAEKAAAKKGSAIKKTDDIESYVYRDDNGILSIPGEYVRQAMIQISKFIKDGRSSQKSAKDLFTAGIISLTDLSPVGKTTWDYLDQRRVKIKSSAITRVRPAIVKGWEASFIFRVILPDYITKEVFQEALADAGRFIGLGDFRPTYGRFSVASIKFL